VTDLSVLDSHIHYEDVGSGRPVVFLHGNPTSSYLWRNVIPAMGSGVRCLAPDLIGMGRSGKPDLAYRFADHTAYLDAWFDALELDDVVVVGHDWGGALAFDWAARHPTRTAGVAFFETIVRPMTWEDLPENARPVFQAFRTDGPGEAAVLEQNVFIEQALPHGILDLSPEDHEVYRAPYPTPESRRPLLAWPRSFPIDGEPADVQATVVAYDRWLAESTRIPKLMILFRDGPGLMGPAVADWCRDNIAHLEVADGGVAGHHAPEDQPETIAAAIVSWMGRHGLTATAASAGTSRN
jgi:haloalkane dehalogenase